MPRIEHLFFDLDGTLTDPAPGIVGCYQHVIAKLGLRARSDAELQQFIGPPLREVLGELLGKHDPASVEQAVALYRERFATQGLYENAVYPGVQELLSESVSVSVSVVGMNDPVSVSVSVVGMNDPVVIRAVTV